MQRSHDTQGKQVGGKLMWISKYTREVVREGKRVRWPNAETFWPAFGVVIIISVFAALILVLEDTAAKELLDQLQRAFSGFGG